MKAYKFLAAGARGRFSDLEWPPPGTWVSAAGTVEQCRCGIHACSADELLDWLDDELWEVELGGAVEQAPTGFVASRGRLVDRVEAWDDELASTLTASCTETAKEHIDTALRRLGLARTADKVAAASSVADLAALVPASDEPAAALVAFAADASLLSAGARPEELDGEGAIPPPAAIAANVAYVAAHIVGCAAGEEGYDAAFAAERNRQRRWLRERLQL